MFELIAFMVIDLVVTFILHLLETAWATVYDDDIATYERRRGGESATTKKTKSMLRERMAVVTMLLTAIHFDIFFSPLIFAWLAKGRNGLKNILLGAYSLILFAVGELLAKNLGYKHGTISAVASTRLLQTLMPRPVRWLFRFISVKEARLYKEEDVVATAQVAEAHGALHAEEADFIERYLAIGNRPVKSMMIPLSQCTRVSLKPTVQELRDALEKHSRIVVVGPDDPQTVMGVVSSKNVVRLVYGGSPSDRLNLTKYLRDTIDMPSNMTIPDCSRLLRRRPIGVVTESGKTLGIITIRDILALMADAASE